MTVSGYMPILILAEFISIPSALLSMEYAYTLHQNISFSIENICWEGIAQSAGRPDFYPRQRPDRSGAHPASCALGTGGKTAGA
jgi:hypothetical protein